MLHYKVDIFCTSVTGMLAWNVAAGRLENLWAFPFTGLLPPQSVEGRHVYLNRGDRCGARAASQRVVPYRVAARYCRCRAFLRVR